MVLGIDGRHINKNKTMQPPRDVSMNAGRHACSRAAVVVLDSPGWSTMHARSTPNPPPNRRHRSIPNRQPESRALSANPTKLNCLARASEDEISPKFRQVHTFLLSWLHGYTASRQNSRQLATQGITGSSRSAATCLPQKQAFP